MNEATENQKYKKLIRSALKETGKFCPFQKERQMDHLFSLLGNDFKRKNQRILDACCGYGRLLYFLNKFDSEQTYTGIDYLPELIEQGTALFAGCNNIKLECLDVFQLSKTYGKEFDISINYKTLSWLPYYTGIMKELIAVTRNKIYITSLFYDGDIDFLTRIYTDAKKNNDDHFTFLNTYSLPKFKDYCLSLGAKTVNSNDMHLDFDLPKPRDMDQLKTYTIPKTDGSRLEVTGTMLLNWKLVEVIL